MSYVRLIREKTLELMHSSTTRYMRQWTSLTLLGLQKPAHVETSGSIVPHAVCLQLPRIQRCCCRHPAGGRKNDAQLLFSTGPSNLRTAQSGESVDGDRDILSRTCLDLDHAIVRMVAVAHERFYSPENHAYNVL